MLPAPDTIVRVNVDAPLDGVVEVRMWPTSPAARHSEALGHDTACSPLYWSTGLVVHAVSSPFTELDRFPTLSARMHVGDVPREHAMFPNTPFESLSATTLCQSLASPLPGLVE
jgi:hypothetical protein